MPSSATIARSSSSRAAFRKDARRREDTTGARKPATVLSRQRGRIIVDRTDKRVNKPAWVKIVAAWSARGDEERKKEKGATRRGRRAGEKKPEKENEMARA